MKTLFIVLQLFIFIMDNHAFGKQSLLSNSSSLLEKNQKIYAEFQQLGLQTSLSSYSFLGRYGVLGAWGPFGDLGPIGSFGASRYMSFMNDYLNKINFESRSFSQTGQILFALEAQLMALGQEATLSIDGPLGINGAIGEELSEEAEFFSYLEIDGPFSILGPYGPMGPAGVFGPLGVLGGHGCRRNHLGEFLCPVNDKKQWDLDSSQFEVLREIPVLYDDGQIYRTYELYEHYEQSYALSKTDNDTSFWVRGNSSNQCGPMQDCDDTYTFTSSHNQCVTVLVTPLNEWNDFDFFVYDEFDHLIIKADSRDVGEYAPPFPLTSTYLLTALTRPILPYVPQGRYIDWATFKVKKGQKIKVKIHHHWQGPFSLSADYHLFVTGSGPWARGLIPKDVGPSLK